MIVAYMIQSFIGRMRSMDNFEFQFWEPGQVVRTREIVHVTLNKDCQLYFNARALEALGEPDGVSLMYDPKRQVIGVLPSALNRSHTYRLRKKQRDLSGRTISAKNFCKFHNIQPGETVAFRSARINKDGVMILDLQDVRTPKRGEAVNNA